MMILAKDTLLNNRYRIESALAQGGMGTVYRGFDNNLETWVAIKENTFQTSEAVDQFKKEALILARLRHPALPRVTHHFTVGNKQYLVMDFIEGADLWQIIQNQGHPLNEQDSLIYISQICDALAYLHNQTPPIIHRDVKPQNIKITPAGQAVLVDFGISKEQVAGQKTMTGAQGITPGFSPPEQYSGEGTGPASDIYSVGATLYALLTGSAPPDSISLLVKNQTFKPVSQINPAITPEVSQAINWAMELQTTQRPSSLETWRHKLQEIQMQKKGVADTRVSGKDSKPTLTSTKEIWLVDTQGNKYPLKPEQRITIGRQSINTIRIASPQVSRRHASVVILGERCMVYDEGSSNGTFINNHKVGPDGMPFNPGDTLTVGPGQFKLEGISAVQPPSASKPIQPVPLPPPAYAPDTPLIWNQPQNEQLDGLAGMTQMLTMNIAKKMKVMSNAQVAILAVVLISSLVLATYLAGEFIQTNAPWLWEFMPFYFIAGPLAYVLSRRKGSAILVHAPTHFFVLVLTWATPHYLAFIISGLTSGATMEILFGISKLPDWIKYPLGLVASYTVSIITLQLFGLSYFEYVQFIGVALLGFVVYLISEIQKGVKQAKVTLNRG